MALSININDSDPNLKNRVHTPPPREKKERFSFFRKKKDSGRSGVSDLNSSNKPSKKKKVFLLLALTLMVGGIFTASRMIGYSRDLGLRLNPSDILNPIKSDPQLKKDSSGERTNALLVGIDTRLTNQGLQNTDTLIVASYHYEKNELTMISIPRDTYVAIPETEWFVKINGIYNKAEQAEVGTGLEVLKSVIEDYSGLEIQYYGMVDVTAFENIIDIIGGVEVYVENSFTDYAFPAENGITPYQVVSFEQGPQMMDGDTAVKYVRSRKSLDNGEGSDFARARRQQQLLKGVKEKVLSTETLLDPGKVLGILAQVKENVTFSQFTNEDIQAALALSDKGKDLVVHSFVLDPSVGSGKVLTTGVIPEAYSIGPVAGLGVYSDVHKYIGEILANPHLYKDDPAIYVYDTGIGYTEAFEITTQLQEKYPFTNILFSGTLFTDKSGSYIYENSADQKFAETISTFTTSLPEYKLINEKPEYILNRLNGEDISILLGTELSE